MSRFILAVLIAASCLGRTLSQAAGPTTVPDRIERESFYLTAIPPPTPAMRFQFDVDPADVHPGNAAMAYLQAGLLTSAGDAEWVDKAIDADDRHDEKGFLNAAAILFNKPSAAVETADYAGACDHCDWGLTPARLRAASPVPQLNPMRMLANLLGCRARYESRTGRVDDAVTDLRRTFTLGRRVGECPTLVSGLVGIGIIGAAEHEVALLMNRPGAPNLYWALASLPRSPVSFAVAMRGERQFTLAYWPVLAKGRTGEITAEDWRAYATQAAAYAAESRIIGPGVPKVGEPAALIPTDADLRDGAASILPGATDHYARTRHLPRDQVAKMDPQLLAATYVIDESQVASDEAFKLLSLPYPQLLPRWHSLPDHLRQMAIVAPNPVSIALPALTWAANGYAMVDRKLAALTAVEALRSYAAAHDGRLPEKLVDVTDTPVPDNPVTGRPFEYRLADGVATLGDHDPLLADRPLEYTVRVRR